jgi:hypothetical protein
VKILLTTLKGKIQIINSDTGEELKNIGRVDVNINSFGKVTVSIEFKDVELNIESEI